MLRSRFSFKSLVPAFLLAATLGLSAHAGAQDDHGHSHEQPVIDSTAAYVIRDTDHVLGETESSMLFVEYASFSCPHCAHFQQDAWAVIKTEFVDTGLIHFVLRPMMTQPAQIAAIGIIITECSADERYFDAADLLFEWQRTILDTGQSGGDLRPIYTRIAELAGIDETELNTCMADPGVSAMLDAKNSAAFEDGVQGTPTFLIRGKILAIGNEGAFMWGGEPLIIDHQPVPAGLDGDTFRRIILHFLSLPN